MALLGDEFGGIIDDLGVVVVVVVVVNLGEERRRN